MLDDYGNDIKIVYKHYVVHPATATIPAQASCAAHKQGKFAQMAELIWEQGFKARQFDADHMKSLARQLALNMRKFRSDMNGQCVKIVRRDQRELAQVGQRGTPGFFINGRFLSGARPVHMFKELIDEELAKANKRIARGTPVKRYYDKWVVKKGLKKLKRAD